VPGVRVSSLFRIGVVGLAMILLLLSCERIEPLAHG
jgi:hypothetical protein